MNWQDDALRVAALKLLLRGELKCSPTTHELINELDDIGLIVPTRRHNHYQLVAHRQADYHTYLISRWLDYAVYAHHFTKDEPLNVASLRTLRRAVLEMPATFSRLNRKTWSAWASAHSKSCYASPPEGLTITADDVLRVRVNDGLCLSSQGGDVFDLEVWQRLANETVLPERAFAENWTLTGVLPELILTVENLGAFVDIQKPANCLLLLSPGWNDNLAKQFISRLPESISWLHFGDIDPNGLRIGQAFTVGARKPEIWIPRAAAALLETHSLALVDPWSLDEEEYPILGNETLRSLVQVNRWLEQESMLLLPGFFEELQAYCKK